MRRAVPFVLCLFAAAAVAQPATPRTDDLAAATEAFARGDHDTAATLLARVVDSDRRNAAAHHLLARLYLDEQDHRRARRHAERALAEAPDDVAVLETRLQVFQRELSEERAFSMTDGRRAAIARQILALDSANAAAHEERALAYFLEFDWRRGLAEQQGGWDSTAARGMSGAANRALARSRQHLRDALVATPARASAHRLRLRTYAAARDDDGLLAAAHAFHAARPDDPDTALFLALGRYRTGSIAESDTAFARALVLMPDAQRAAFEHVGRFVTKDTHDAYESDSVAFAADFWRSRDPRLLTPTNERRLEHLARLALADLLFTDTQTGQRGWTSTKGEVVIRYGLPTGERTWLANDVLAKDFSRYNRWDYGDFTLLFEDAFRTGDYEFWSSAAGEDEVTRARSLMNRLPERFDFAPPERVAFPALAATFRGENGTTDVVIRYGVPVAGRGVRFAVESGAFLLDADGAIVAERRRTTETTSTAAESYAATTLWTDGFALRAAPGRYDLAVEFDAPAAGALGVRRDVVELPDYRDGDFALSDVLLATAIEEAEGRAPGQVVRNGLAIRPAPWGVFATRQPIYLYAEGYGLTPTDDGYNRYAIEVALQPKDTSRGLARLARSLFGERPDGVAVEFEGSARGRDLGEYVVLDASTQAPGLYELTFSLRDRVTGEARTRTLDLLLE